MADLRAQLIAIALGAHHVGALAVFIGDVELVEQGQRLHRGNDLRRLLWQEDARHLGPGVAHVGDFHGIVVDKNQAVGADIERSGDGRDAFRLGQPVDLPGRQMLAAQHHSAVPVENLPHIGFVVLAGERQQDALVAPIQQQRLEIAVGRTGKFVADLDAVDPVLADDAAPQRIVGVEHDTFFRGTARRHNDAAELMAGGVEERIGKWLPVEIPMPRIKGRGEPDLPLHRIEIGEAHPLDLADLADELGDERVVEGAEAAGIVERQ